MHHATCYDGFNNSRDEKVVCNSSCLVGVTNEAPSKDGSTKTQTTIDSIKYVCNNLRDGRKVAWLCQTISISKIINVELIHVCGERE